MRMLAGLMSRCTSPWVCGVMERLGDDGDEFRRFAESGASLSHSDRQIAAFDELRDHEAEPVFRATHVMNWHDMGMVQLGEDASFVQIRLHILGMGDTSGVRNLDRDRTIEVVVVREVDPSESALTEEPGDPVAPQS